MRFFVEGSAVCVRDGFLSTALLSPWRPLGEERSRPDIAEESLDRRPRVRVLHPPLLENLIRYLLYEYLSVS